MKVNTSNSLGKTETHHVDYMYPNTTSIVTKNAPFGTLDTPVQKGRIIGGKLVYGKEDGYYGTPRWATTPNPQNTFSPRRGGSRASHTNTPTTLAPLLSQNPTTFNPHAVLDKNRNSYSSAQHDIHKSHIHSPDHLRRGEMNPHHVLPPISTPSSPSRQPPTHTHTSRDHAHHSNDPDEAEIRRRVEQILNNNNPRTDLTRYLPTDGSDLPRKSIRLSKSEELELRRLVREDLKGFHTAKLKDLYLELMGFDQDFTECISFNNLLFAFRRAKVSISSDNLRLVASLFIAPNSAYPGGGGGGRMVLYEKILSFLAASQKSAETHTSDDLDDMSEMNIPDHHSAYSSTVPSATHTNVPSTSGTSHKGEYYNPVTHWDHSPRSKKFPYGDRDNTKLLKQIEDALVIDNKDVLDFGHLYDAFRRFDRGHREMLSREQIKALSINCRIPLQESIIDKIIDKVDSSNGQYSWVQYLDFLERVQPAQTGLHLPKSKHPVDYAKQYPEPTTNWPQNNSLQSRQPERDPHVQAKGDSLRHDHQPESSKGQQSETKPEYHQSSISNVEAEIRKLEEAKRKLIAEEEKKKQGQEPWFQRFMKLAKALYDNDIDANGYLPKDEVARMIQLYNEPFSLEFSDEVISKCIRNVSENEDTVPIDALLKSLSLQHS